MLSRLPSWDTRLDAFLQANDRRRFRYGVWDCGIFSGDAVLAMTGVDLAGHCRDRYTTRKGAMELVGSVRRLAETTLTEFDEVPPAAARRGDVVLISWGGRESLGVVALDGRNAVTVGLKGLRYVPVIPNVVRAWRI